MKAASIIMFSSLLAASSSIHAQSPETSVGESTPAQVEACDSAWTSSAIYEAGNVVSYEGRNYTAAYWTQGNSPSNSSGAEGTGQPWRPGLFCARKVIAAKSDPDANFSSSTLEFLKEETGLDGEQWNNIMKLVNKPEQDSLDWTRFYGYCEDIHDGRGYTIGIFGATTGGSNDTGPDGPELFKEYDKLKGASVPSAIHGLARIGVNATMSGSILKIEGDGKAFQQKMANLQNDPTWREAIWRTFYHVDIQYSVEQARRLGFSSALTIGAFVDTALNQGATGDSNSLQGLLSRVDKRGHEDEKTFMNEFFAERAKVVDTHSFNSPPNGKNRVKQWSTLMNQGDTDLKNVDDAIVKVTDWKMH